ncbi:MAG: HlyC/CorC family transporter [Campylobacterales bacterium]|nr:HlyC/CorC family transporter [Campylobacterales bacterium]
MTLLLTYLFVALLLSFICSVLEAVLLSSTNSYIASISKQKDSPSIEYIKKLKSNIDRPISSILIVNTFAHTIGAAGVGAQAQLLFGSEWQAVVAFILTLLILYISEIIPKTIGVLYWKKLLIPSAFLIKWFMQLTFPLVWISGIITNFISQGKEKEGNFSRDEIMAMVAMGEKEGSILAKESDLIENLLKLKNIKAKDVMTPRSVVFALSYDTKVEDAIEDDRMYIHSRIPIYEDNIDNVIGLVLSQEILEESVEERDDTLMKDIAMDIHRVSENIPVSTLIDQFVKRKTHLFLVHDSYGQTAGIVTFEDVFEALLGVEIVDEMDEVEDMQAFAKDRSRIIQDKKLLEKQKKAKTNKI